jgi:hypothetical protein
MRRGIWRCRRHAVSRYDCAGERIGEASGTSFATPVASHGIIGLAARLGPSLTSPEVLRAFALHFAQSPDSQPAEDVGFGRLAERYDGHWNYEPHEATILYRDSIERNQVISLPFPLVAAAVAGRTVELSWTLVLTAATDPPTPSTTPRTSLTFSSPNVPPSCARCSTPTIGQERRGPRWVGPLQAPGCGPPPPQGWHAFGVRGDGARSRTGRESL